MSSLGLLKMTLILSVLFSAHKIWAFEFNSMILEPYSRTIDLQDTPNLSNTEKEYIQYIYSLGKPYNQNINRKIFVSTNEFDNKNRQNWKRNGDLINSLLGLPQGLMEAGR